MKKIQSKIHYNNEKIKKKSTLVRIFIALATTSSPDKDS